MKRITAWATLFVLSVLVLLGSAIGDLLDLDMALMRLGLWGGVASLWVLIMAFVAFREWFDGPVVLVAEGPDWRP